jgi:hypothetical protein
MAAVFVCGCHSAPTPSYPIWEAAQPPYAPRSGSGNAFDAYALASVQVEKDGQKYIDRVFFTPGQKLGVEAATASAIADVARAQANPCQFQFVPRGPFDRAPYQRGWRLIGRSLAWRAEDACAAGKYDDAINDAVTGTRFGFDLTGGSATDASLGLETVNDIRRAIAPHLDEMGVEQLEKLSHGIDAALRAKPPLSQMIGNEHHNMMRAVQYVQDAYSRDSYDELRKMLGVDVKDAITFLKDLRQDDALRRPPYFQNFAAEGDEEARWLTSLSEMAVVDRQKASPPNNLKVRPWKRFAKAFFTAPQPLLDVNDSAVARTRLLILHCEILRDVKVNKTAPKGLGEFSRDVTTDPFSGKPFVYTSSGANFALYSVGADFQDNGGDSDSSYTTPDLLLERPRN